MLRSARHQPPHITKRVVGLRIFSRLRNSVCPPNLRLSAAREETTADVDDTRETVVDKVGCGELPVGENVEGLNVAVSVSESSNIQKKEWNESEPGLRNTTYTKLP